MILRDYQQEIATKGLALLNKYKFVYLAMEVRTGKTATSLSMVSSLPVTNCLFVTKKKAISSIESDYEKLSLKFHLTVINYESLHKIPNIRWGCVILDEAHGLGAFPKASKRAKQVRSLINKHLPYVILLSGTPTPESYSQMYHQVYGIPSNPFSKYKNFYRFSDDYVDVRVKPLGGVHIRDYSRGSEEIIHKMKPHTIMFTQKDAGFKVDTNEQIMYVSIPNKLKKLIKRLTTDRVIEGKDNTILADTGVKLMSKTHQLYSGTVKFESGKSMVLDSSKAIYIKDVFRGKKIAIFYKFTAEYDAIKDVFGDSVCNTLDEFCNTDKNIALQIVSGREGISLKDAEALVYYNIDFSATSYWQSRDRMTTKDRLYNKVYWIFAKGGIEDSIYKAVVKKKDYTLNHFKRDLLTL